MKHRDADEKKLRFYDNDLQDFCSPTIDFWSMFCDMKKKKNY